MIARFFACLSGVLLLAGCMPRSPVPATQAKGTAPPAPPYVSKVDSPQAKALFHFAQASLLLDEGKARAALQALERTVALDPHAVYPHLALAGLYLRLGEEEKALQATRAVLSVEPSSVDAHLLLGNIYYSRNKYALAAEAFQKALHLDPSRETIYLHLAVTYARGGKMDRAAKTLNALLQRYPSSVIGHLTLARLYAEQGQTIPAVAEYRQVLALAPDFAAAYLELGALYEAQKDYAKALAVYREALQQNQDSVELRHRVVRILIRQNRLEAARGELQQILTRQPEDLEARRKLGLIDMEQKNWDGAIAEFSTILKSRPELAPVRFYLGTAYERKEQWHKALQAFERIPPGSDLYDDALAHRSYLAQRLGRTSEAIALLEKRLAQGKARPEFYSFLASLYEGEKHLDEALGAIDKGLAVHPHNAELSYQRGVLLDQQGKKAAAIAAMRRAVKFNPKFAEALNYLAYTFAEQGQHLQEALHLARRALQLKPAPHIRDTLGWVYYKLGRLSQARRELEKASAGMPSDPIVLRHLGDVYRDLHLYGKARKIYQRILKQDPANKMIRERLRRLPRK